MKVFLEMRPPLSKFGRRFFDAVLPFMWSVIALGGVAGCGAFPLGTGAAPNDPVPVGQLVAQGVFSTVVAAKPVTGTVTILKEPTDGSYVIRLESLSAPDESGLQLIGVAGTTTVFSRSLRAITGNQNYATGLTSSLTWSSVSIRNILDPNQNYATAQLQSP